MKRHEMPFEYWEDQLTLKYRLTMKRLEDRDAWFRYHLRMCSQGPFQMNGRCWNLYQRDGVFAKPYKEFDLYEKMPGCGFVFFPGPSLKDFGEISRKLCCRWPTIAVNSARFRVPAKWWFMAENGYAFWAAVQNLAEVPGRPLNVICTARSAVALRAFGAKIDSCRYVLWEENKLVPIRSPAPSAFGAFITLWQMGVNKIYAIGLDLSKPDDKPYVEGVPFTDVGAKNPFDDQILALKQFQLPGLRVFNGSPYSRGIFESTTYEDIREIFEGSQHEAAPNAI